MAYEACRLALKYMTPVMLLSDGYITNCSGPWKIVDPAELPEITNHLITETNNPDGAYLPYKRDAETMARTWAIPGTPGLEHRIGGLEKEALTGAVNYDGENHELMIKAREAKVAGMVKDIPLLEVDGDASGELLIVGWGGTEGTLIETTRQARQQGIKVSRIHLHYINPFPANLGEILKSFKKVLVPEINRGQLRRMIRDQYLVDAQGLNVTTGQPLRVNTVLEHVKSLLGA
ncbi:MAG: 2-oxoglutarate ferredoxin oxidoreductase subunit alpha, partial [bacterium]|nr:2-oxoglutarate ferredoxin oxidoreductase subunit alpha [bacterium]